MSQDVSATLQLLLYGQDFTSAGFAISLFPGFGFVEGFSLVNFINIVKAQVPAEISQVKNPMKNLIIYA